MADISSAAAVAKTRQREAGAGPVPPPEDGSADLRISGRLRSQVSRDSPPSLAGAGAPSSEVAPLFISGETHFDKRRDASRGEPNVTDEPHFEALCETQKAEKENVNESSEEEKIRGAKRISYHT